MILAAKTILILLLYSLACLGLGIFLLRLLNGFSRKAPPLPLGTGLASGFILGQGVLANLWLLLSLAQWFSPLAINMILLASLITGLVWGRPFISDWFRDFWLKKRPGREDSCAWRVVQLLTVLIALAGATSLGRPLVGDAVSCYLGIPKILVNSHRLFAFVGCDAQIQAGMAGEMHTAALMSLANMQAARLFTWINALVTGLLLAGICAKLGVARRGQWLATGMLFTSTAFLLLIGDNKIDLYAAALGLAAYLWALNTEKSQKRLSLALTGLLAGAAVYTKYTYVVTLLPGLVFLTAWSCYVQRLRENPPDQSAARFSLLAADAVKAWLFMGLWFLLAISPHLLKNGLLYANPLAPLAENIEWSDLKCYSDATTWRIIFTYPLALTFGSYWGQYGNLSPLVLAFAPLAFFLPRPRPFWSSPLVAATTAAFLCIVAWIVFRPSWLFPRYMLASLLMLTPLAARGAEYVCSLNWKPNWPRWWVLFWTVLALFVVGQNMLQIHWFPLKSLGTLAGGITQEELGSPASEALSVLNKTAEAGARVYFQSFDYYWLRPDLIQCLAKNYPMAKLPTPEAGWRYIREQGCGYLVIDEKTHGMFNQLLNIKSPPPWIKLKRLSYKHKTAVYRVIYEKPPVEPCFTCRQIKPPAWDVVEP